MPSKKQRAKAKKQQEPEPEYDRLGMKVTKVHRVITFSQAPWLKSYIDFNTDKRKVAKNEFEKAFFKLMNNSCFGKTMENLRDRVDIKFVTSNSEYGGLCPKHDRTVERKLASHLYDGHIIFSNDLTAIKQKKKSLVLNKPIYAGMCILDLSKYWMYQFHYDVIKQQYGNRAKLLFTDTDSLCYHIKTKDFYKEMRTDEYDLSDYPEGSDFHSTKNKKVLGKFKDECNGAAPAEFVGLRPKMYSLKIPEQKDKKTAKGVQGSAQKKITHADYRRCLLSEETADKQQHVKQCAIRHTKHILYSVEQNKVGLCAYDNKRYLLNDVDSLAYGHVGISSAASGAVSAEDSSAASSSLCFSTRSRKRNITRARAIGEVAAQPGKASAALAMICSASAWVAKATRACTSALGIATS